MKRKVISTRAKALEINLDDRIYGSLAEIGAGQDVATHFFKAGGASGTIAKTMSAYSMEFSDAIYGKERSGRYVCESRLSKMLDKEYKLLETRLNDLRGSSTCFFAFANTVAATQRGTDKDGHGWLGVRFQTEPQGEANELTIHVNLDPAEITEQQFIIGTVGVNLIYACMYYRNKAEDLIDSLVDNLEEKKIEINRISLTGPSFLETDNRCLNLWLVKRALTDAVLFDPEGNPVEPKEVLYKKPILALRGSFRPPTLVNEDMLSASVKQFSEENLEKNKVVTLCEITLSNLRSQSNMDEHDFLSRIDLLTTLNQYVLISNYDYYYKLSTYLHRYTNCRVAIALGIDNLERMFSEEHFMHLDGGLLEAIGRLFSNDTKLFVYPQKTTKGEFITGENFKAPKQLQYLYEFLRLKGSIEAYKYVNMELLDIYSKNILKKIKNNELGWEESVSKLVADTIKSNHLFGFKDKKSA